MVAKDNNKMIAMQNITKIFPGVKALDSVNFSVKQGEIRGLVGKNGAGKSTLMNVLSGIYSADSGDISIDGERVPKMTSTLAKRLGISYVHQHTQLVPTLTMAENIFCGDLPKNKFGLINWKTLNNEAEKFIKKVGLQIDVTRTVEAASVAECQMIEIIKALFADAKVVILDEATAPLPKSEVDSLFHFIRNLRDHGVTFIYISHYLSEVFQLCDSVSVLRDGRNAGDFDVSKITQKDLIASISGSNLKEYKRTPKNVKEKKDRKPILEIKGLSRERCYEDIVLSFFPGEVVGITGLDGCGKDNLVKGLFGIEPKGQGDVILDGKNFTSSKSPTTSFRQGMAYLPRDRHGFGIIGIRPINENITLTILKKLLSPIRLLSLRKEKLHVSNMIKKLNIITPSQDQLVTHLSGGNQQKVVFAKLIGTEPKILFLDEPTQGIDIQAKEEVLKIVDELSSEGTSIVIISEEINELLKICDRIVVMYSGKIKQEFLVDAPETSYQNILMAVEGN